jgi:adenylate kinase family enzyme
MQEVDGSIPFGSTIFFSKIMTRVLGSRICIIGGSSTGKSTLARKLGDKYGFPVHHLDQYHHEPHGNWIARPAEEYLKLHNTAIASEHWIIEGNYTRSMPQRFERADTIIQLSMNRFGSLWRAIQRHFSKHRIGQPVGIKDKFNWGFYRAKIFKS